MTCSNEPVRGITIPLLFEVGQRTGEPRAFVGIVENVSARNRFSIDRRNSEDVIESSIVRMVFDAFQRRLYATSTATRKSSSPPRSARISSWIVMT